MTYGRNRFKKDRGCIAYYIEMDITGSVYGIEAGTWNAKTVPAASCLGYEDCTDDGMCFVRQTVRGITLKGGDGHVEAEILQGVCKGQKPEKNDCILG